VDQGSYVPIRTEDIPPLLATTFFTFATSGRVQCSRRARKLSERIRDEVGRGSVVRNAGGRSRVRVP
jgi:hypothetical protein